MLKAILAFFLDNKLITLLLIVVLVLWGIVTAPFAWKGDLLPSDPVPVDAIPDLGENQQIVFVSWEGHAPEDIDDQVTYPLSTALQGLPKVRKVRSSSMFGFASIYVIFEDDADFYWSRSRILEKLNALPADLLPPGVKPRLGPDATGLGQVFWYTLEGVDEEGRPAGGWDLPDLRAVQDNYVRHALSSVEGVAEVASIGGFVGEYQVDIDPQALQAYDLDLATVMRAVRGSNLDVGARTLEINSAEYLVRGLGQLKALEELESTVVAMREGVAVRLGDIAQLQFGPADRRGMLDKSGAEAVGGVVVARFDANPMAVIAGIKAKIAEISPGLPRRTLANGSTSQIRILPFYDRSELIQETLGTLESALWLEILITILVIILLLLNLRASVLVSGLLPVAVLTCFILMRYLEVDANIVALSGIAIAIGTMVDMGIVLVENIMRRLSEAAPSQSQRDVILEAAHEVAGAVLTAVLTTIVSFVPVFTMEAAEGKLFRPLASTKTFALAAAIVLALVMLPALVHLGTRLAAFKVGNVRREQVIWGACVLLLGTLFFSGSNWWWPLLLGMALLLGFQLLDRGLEMIFPAPWAARRKYVYLGLVAVGVWWLLAREWLPLGPGGSLAMNLLFVGLVVGMLLGLFAVVIQFYAPILTWCLSHKKLFLTFPALLLVLGLLIWQGFPRLMGPLERAALKMGWELPATRPWRRLAAAFPGTEKEFMPTLDEGDFLLMPSTMPHAGTAEVRRLLAELDMAVTAIPEVEMVVGKAGRVASALDPAPLSMFENVIRYKSEYLVDTDGRRLRFRTDADGGFLRDSEGALIPDERGAYFRQWRDHIRSADDIWAEIATASQLPGLTTAPRLQPIQTRLLMLQTGMRAPMGIKVQGPHLDSIQRFAEQLADRLRAVPEVQPETVFADRILGKPYLQLEVDRARLTRYGLRVETVQEWIAVAIGGRTLTHTVEGRDRYAVRLRFPAELRNTPEAIQRILVRTPSGQQVPLGSLVDITFGRGPQVIKSEDTFLTSYVLFDGKKGIGETTVVEAAMAYLQAAIAGGELAVPAGVSYSFTGSYENQLRANRRLSFVLPIVLAIIFLILYWQFRSVALTLMVFSGIAVAFAGGFLMIWLYGEPWFLNFSFLGTNLRTLFNMDTIHLSVAVWVGFIALFGIATDDGVVMATYLKQSFQGEQPGTIQAVRDRVIAAGQRRIRPCLMTTATTILALLPILSSHGKGADIMVPMAIPVFGGMAVELLTLLIVPVLYSWWQEAHLQPLNS